MHFQTKNSGKSLKCQSEVRVRLTEGGGILPIDCDKVVQKVFQGCSKMFGEELKRTASAAKLLFLVLQSKF